MVHHTALQINTECMIVFENVFLTCLWAYILTREHYLQGDPKSNDELKSESKAPKLRENESQIIDQLPQVETIGMILFLFIGYILSRLDKHLPSLHQIMERKSCILE